MTTFAMFIAWCGQHPGIVALFWWSVSAVLTGIFKPKTAEQYAALAENWPRLAATLKLMGALGIDPAKTVMAAKQVVTGSQDPEKTKDL